MFAQLKRSLIATCLLLIAAAPMLQAQEVASSFDQLRVLVRRGDTVSVTDTSGRKVNGQIAELSSSSLALLVGGNRSDLAEGAVRTIRQQRHGDLAAGATWGLGIGAAVGVFGAVASGWGATGPTLLATALYGVMGSGIGVGISAAITRQQVIYAKPGTASTELTVAPLVTRDRQGICSCRSASDAARLAPNERARIERRAAFSVRR